jgi:hypothetical protein
LSYTEPGSVGVKGLRLACVFLSPVVPDLLDHTYPEN